jgi:putative Mg2+ transporter-C (MgtC) family protein
VKKLDRLCQELTLFTPMDPLTLKKLSMQMPEDIVWKLLLALLIGGIIGAEREYRSKTAGFRTLTLICLGATLFTVFSEMIGGPRGTPDRIASNVVVGIGFVGAGVIFKGENQVTGITTAALIWVTAALGMAIGAGFKLLAVIGCLMVLFVLLIFTVMEGWIDRMNQIRNYKIICDFQNETLHRYEQCFKNNHLKFKRSREIKTGEQITGEWIVQGTQKNHRHFIEIILRDPTVNSFEF